MEALLVLALLDQVRRFSHLLLCSYSACGRLGKMQKVYAFQKSLQHLRLTLIRTDSP